MRRVSWFVIVLAAAAALDSPVLRAQSFQGTGQEATELFAVEAGLVVFEMEHQGTGPFAVRLLDQGGRVVEELAQASGAFRGSKAVRVEQSGSYLLDVSASGPWSVRRRDPGATAAVSTTSAAPVSAAFTRGQEAGAAAAAGVPTGGWLARGMLGGTLAGPIGAAIAVGIAGRTGVPTPALEGPQNGDADYRQGFEDGFAARVREQRKKKAFIGGMLGSGIFLTGLILIADLAQGGNGGGGTTEPGGGGDFVIVPR